jgi:N-acetylglucosamine-6-phosphate deacetylase
VLPGFIDIHVHGGGGHSFFTRDPSRIAAYAAWAPRNGVTAFLVSVVGSDSEDTSGILSALRPAIDVQSAGATALGFHLEGPFINPLRRGAFPGELLRPPSAAEFAGYQDAAGGTIRQATLAPELPGALDLIREVVASGAIAAMGHTDASIEQARAGFAAGIGHVTHLFNAMRPLHQREGGPVAAALLSQATCELIFDGMHVSPEMLQLAFGLLGSARTVAVTDNLYLAGSGTTEGRFAGGTVRERGGVAQREDGTIVGSTLTMDQHFRNVVQILGVDLVTASAICSTNAASLLGLSDLGSTAEGSLADLVLVDDRLDIVATLCSGRVAYLRDAWRLA